MLDFPDGPTVDGNLPTDAGGHGFDPCSRKILLAVGQLSPGASTTQPAHQSPRATGREAGAPRVHAPQKEKPHNEKPMYHNRVVPTLLN